MSFISKEYFAAQLLFIKSQSIKAFILTIILYISNFLHFIEPWLFGKEFIQILTVLLMSDMAIGVIKHMKIGDFAPSKMFNKFVFKIMMISIATVSAKAMLNIDNILSSAVLIVAIKLTIAMYLFLNIEKNICKMTEGNLCFKFFVDKLKTFLPNKKES